MDGWWAEDDAAEEFFPDNTPAGVRSGVADEQPLFDQYLPSRGASAAVRDASATASRREVQSTVRAIFQRSSEAWSQSGIREL